jgi:hypothetical protein
MKKFIAAVAVLSLVATPAFADGYRGDRGHHQRHERHERHERGVSTSGAVAIGLGALILGGIISRSNEERYRNPPQVIVVPQPQVQPVMVCESAHYLRDNFGNIVRDQYGYDIVVPQRCWYQ